MFCVFSAQSIAFSLLIGSLFILASCQDDGEDAIEPQSSEIDDTSVEQSDNDTETTDECKHPDAVTKEKCCSEFDIDDHVIRCALLHQNKMPKDGEEDPKVLIKFVSCLVECIYKGKKYMGKGDTLNMNIIKADAKKKHKKDPKMEEYTIEMFSHCERHAESEWGQMKSNPAAKVIFSGACRPYFMFVFMCTMNYGVKVNCPYYAWKGEKTSTKNTVAECKELKSKCENLHN